MRPRTFGVKILVTDTNDDGLILLVRHSYGNRALWNIPGGGYNPKRETAFDAAKREILEELGLTLSNLRELGVYETSGEGKRDSVTLISGTLAHDGAVIRGSEVEEFGWESWDRASRREDVARVARRAIELRFGVRTGI